MFTAIFILVLFTFLQITTARNYGQCTTPKNEVGSCIDINECSSIYQLSRRTSTTSEEITFLQKSQCGFLDPKILVCCPPESPLPRPPNCGTVLTTRIKGGNITAIDEHPWTAFLEYTNHRNEKKFGCGGSLISDRYVLTAAHCLLGLEDNYHISGIRLGEWKLDTNPDYDVDARGTKYWAPQYIRVNIEGQIIHPQYVVGAKGFDIALLRLSKTITMNNFIQPICLPFEPSLRNQTFVNREADVVGWGYTEGGMYSNIKLKATLTIWETDRCKAKYRSGDMALQSDQMCAGGTRGIDACRGDSGGPLVLEESIANKPSSYFIIGVVSFGTNPCGLLNWPGVYTRVTDYLDWIANNVKP